MPQRARQLAAISIAAIFLAPMGAAQVADPLDPVGHYVELDGDILGQSSSLDDWADIHAGVALADAGTPVFIPDWMTADVSYHGGSDKDTQEVTQWRCETSAHPQAKTDILNAYAVHFLDPAGAGTPYLYFGFERATNNGNSFMGFWFLQRTTQCVNGAFTGGHRDGDLLVLSNFTNGGNAAGISVYRWQAGQLVFAALGGECPEVEPAQPLAACGKVNDAAIQAPWRDGAVPRNTFFEGALNLAAFFQSNRLPCFASFVAETRTSQSVTATLKDFAAGSFNTCDARITLSPPASVHDVGETQPITALVETREGTSWEPAGSVDVTFSLSGVGSLGALTCRTAPDGTCNVAVTSLVGGTSLVHGAINLTMGSTPLERGADATVLWNRIALDSFVTTPSRATLDLGGSLTDAASLAGRLGAPTGNVSFQACLGETCASVGRAAIASGAATSPSFTPTSAGHWCFRATYEGDGTYLGETETGEHECFDVQELVPDLDIVKEVRKASAPFASSTGAGPGDTLHYRITVTNSGTGVARDVVVTDVVPSALAFAGGACSGCSASGNALTWSLGDVAAGASVPLFFNATVLPAVEGAWPVDNVASVASSNAGSTPSLPATATIVAAADVLMAKSAPPSVRPGGEFTFRVVAWNRGNGTAPHVNLTDLLPDGLVLLSASATGATCYTDESQLRCYAVGIAPGTTEAGPGVTIDIRVRLGPSIQAGDTIENQAAATWPNSGSSISNIVQVLVTAPDIRLTKAIRTPGGSWSLAGAGANPGATVEYRLTVANLGDDAGHDITVTDDIGDLVFAGSPCSGCVENAGVMSWTFATLAAGESRDLFFNATVPLVADGDWHFPNSATATEGGVTSTSNLVDLLVRAVADVLVAKTSESPTVQEGGTIAYTIAYWNVGNATATDVDVLDALPDHVTLVSVTPVDPTVTCFPAESPLRCRVPQVASGTDELSPAGSIQLVVTLGPEWQSPQVVPNAALAEWRGGDAASPTASVFVTVVSVELGLAKSVKNATSGWLDEVGARRGDIIQVRIVVRNDGNVGATGVMVNDTLSPLLDLTGDCSGCLVDGSLLTWDLGALGAGAQRALYFNVTVLGPLAAGTTTIPNVARVSDTDGDETTSNAATIRAASVADVRIAKSAPAEVLVPPGTMTYTLNIWNAGDGVTNATVRDTLPADVSILDIAVTGDTTVACDLSLLPALRCEVVRVEPGSSASLPAVILEIAVQLGPSWEGGDVLRNTALVTPGSGSPRSSNEVQTTVVTPALLSAFKYVLVGGSPAPNTTAAPGDAVTFRIVVDNGGSETAHGVSTTDALPAGMARESGDCSGTTSVTCSFGDLAGGAQASKEFVVRLAATFPEGETILDNVAVGHTTDNSDTFESAPARVTVVAPSDLHLLKRALSETFLRGGTASWEVLAWNAGAGSIASVNVVDELPLGTTFQSCTPSCAHDAGIVTWTVALPAHMTQADAVVLRVNATLGPSYEAGDSVENTARLRGITVTTVTDVVFPGSRVLKTVALPGGTPSSQVNVVPGDTVVFTLSYRNLGESTAHNVTLRDTLVAGLEFVSCTLGCAFDAPSRTATWDLGDVAGPSAEDLNLTLTARVADDFPPGTTTLQNVAVFESDEEAPQASPPAFVIVGVLPDLQVLKTIVGQTGSNVYATPGARLTYRIDYWNAGRGDVSSATIWDKLPAGLLLVDCSAGCNSADPTNVTWTVAVPNETSQTSPAGVLFLNVTVDPDSPSCTVCNTVGVQSAEVPGVVHYSPQMCFAVVAGAGGATSAADAYPLGYQVHPIGPGTIVPPARYGQSSSGVAGEFGDEFNDGVSSLTFSSTLAGILTYRTLNSTSLSHIEVSERSRVVANSTSTSEIAGLRIEIPTGGEPIVITADLIKAVAYARAESGRTTVLSKDSTIVNLRIDGALVLNNCGSQSTCDENVPDNTPPIDLPNREGMSGYIRVKQIWKEQHDFLSGPNAGAYADTRVAMLHIYITGNLQSPLPGTTEITVGFAHARSTAPPAPNCTPASSAQPSSPPPSGASRDNAALGDDPSMRFEERASRIYESVEREPEWLAVGPSVKRETSTTPRRPRRGLSSFSRTRSPPRSPRRESKVGAPRSRGPPFAA